MTKVTAITLTALVLLLASAMAVSAVDKVEIRGPVANIGVADHTWGPQDFAGFYYDIDEEIGTEQITLKISNVADDQKSADLEKDEGVIYTTTAQPKDFDFEAWGEYLTIGFLAEEYFAAYVAGGELETESTDSSLLTNEKLSKVLMDDDEDRTFTSGTPLKLAEDYELAIQAIDLDGNKVYVQLMKSGAVVDSAVVEPSVPGKDGDTYVYKKDMGDTKKIVVVAVHFKNAFRGAETDLATVNGVWQISDTYTDVAVDTEYNKMTIQSVTGNTITLNNDGEKISLTNDKSTLLMENIGIRTADQDDDLPLRFYIYKEITEPGTYEIRSTVNNLGLAEVTWDTATFAGFFYDIDEEIGTEQITLKLSNVADDKSTADLEKDEGVIYTTTAQPKAFEFEAWEEYLTIGFLAEEYFAAYVAGGELETESTDSSLLTNEKLSKVLMDEDDDMTVTSGTPLKLAEDYELAIQAIDLDGNKVYVQLMKNGAVVDSAVVEPSVAGKDGDTYVYKKDLGDTKKLVIIAVHFKNAFRGAETDLATIDGIWQISDTYTDVAVDTEYDKMTIQSVSGNTITLNNDGEKISLSKDKDTLLMEGIRIKTADQEATPEEPLRFYIYKEMTIEGEEAEEAAPAPVEAPAPAVEEPVAEEPVAEEPVAEEPVAEEPVAEEPAAEEHAEEPAAEPAGGIPGFEAVFALTGLLAVSYLVLRKRE